jgi:hypothetical protein
MENIKNEDSGVVWAGGHRQNLFQVTKPFTISDFACPGG